MTGRWAQRTPPEFTFHVKAHASMTGHEAGRADQAFAEFRASLEPLELSGKLRGILLQYHPRFRKSAAAKAELERCPTSSPRSSRSSSSGIAPGWRKTSAPTRSRSSNGTASRTSRSTRLARARPTSCRPSWRRPRRCLRPLPRPQCEDVEHPAPRSRGSRFDWMYERKSSPSGSRTSAGWRQEADEVYALFNNNRDDFAPRSAAILRGLLDEAGVPASGGLEPPPVELRRSFEARDDTSSSATERARAPIASCGRHGRPRTKPPLRLQLVLDAQRPHRQRLASGRRALHDDRHGSPGLPALADIHNQLTLI